ncbi:hypothetical protein T484DRAFT_1746284 [Baffinella frigidus]|nr:hypothetical protein T484DRAFT_1746284 [Cryptophyta sp. CCMP2293]
MAQIQPSPLKPGRPGAYPSLALPLCPILALPLCHPAETFQQEPPRPPPVGPRYPYTLQQETRMKVKKVIEEEPERLLEVSKQLAALLAYNTFTAEEGFAHFDVDGDGSGTLSLNPQPFARFDAGPESY